MFLTFVFTALLLVAPDAISNFHLGVGDEHFCEADFGLHELRCLIQQGDLRFGDRVVVVCMLGRADVMRGRQFSGVLERFIKACNTVAPDTHIVFGGPFPDVWDEGPYLARLRGARHYLEERVASESHFHYSGISFRFADPERGINERLLTEGGLTTRGCEILRRDLYEIVSAIPEVGL